MTSIATFSWFTQTSADLSRMQKQMAELNRQTAQQTKAADLQGYGGASAQVVSTKAVIAAAEGGATAAKNLGNRLSMVDTALTSASDATEALRQSVLSAVGNEDGTTVAADLATAFRTVSDAFNTTYNGDALFGGQRTDGSPVNVSSLAALAAAPSTSAIFDVSSQSQTVDLGQGAFSIGQNASQIGSGVFDAMRSLQQLLDANGGTLSSPLTSAEKASLTTIAQSLNTARQTVTTAQAVNGNLQNSVDTQATALSNRADAYKSILGDQTEVDLASVAAQLAQVETQYQASASVFTTLKSMTLLNFLTTSSSSG
jgi:flagellar hook-associated protein 3 FlgL